MDQYKVTYQKVVTMTVEVTGVTTGNAEERAKVILDALHGEDLYAITDVRKVRK